MISFKLTAPLCALTILAGCEAKFGDRADAPANNVEVVADGGKEGEFSLKAPGIDMKIDIPKGVADQMNVDSQNDILYPGAKLAGIHIDAQEKNAGDRSQVELNFTSVDAPDKLAAWYQDKARGERFTIGSVTREGSGYALAATDEDGDPFSVKLTAAPSGGTAGRVLIQDRK